MALKGKRTSQIETSDKWRQPLDYNWHTSLSLQKCAQIHVYYSVMAGEYTGHGATQTDRGKSISPCPGINDGNVTKPPDNQLNPTPVCLFLYVSPPLQQSLPEGGGCRCVINKTHCWDGIDEVAYGGRSAEDDGSKSRACQWLVVEVMEGWIIIDQTGRLRAGSDQGQSVSSAG